MKVLVDADAVPRAIREILIRVAEREKLPCVFSAQNASPVAVSSSTEIPSFFSHWRLERKSVV